MFGLLKSLFQRPRQNAHPARTVHDGVRLGLEELEDRVVPTVFSFQDAMQFQTQFQFTAKSIQSQLQVVTRTASTLSATVTADLKLVAASLKAVIADVSAGRSPTADLKALFNAQAHLFSHLGSNITSVVRQELSTFGPELTRLIQNLRRLDTTTNGDLTDVKQAVQTLVTALASNTNPTVVADLNTLKADLNAVVADLAAGRSAAADLKKLAADENTLIKDLGTSIPHDIRVDLLDLRQDAFDLSRDLILVNQLVRANLSQIQAHVQRVTTALASNLSPVITADVNALNSAVSTLVSDLAAGRPVNDDVNTVITDLTKLITDLKTDVNSSLAQQLRMLRGNLLTLALEIALLTF